ncbi:MAG: hypothetical protein DMG02_26830 [Acidobacteria bacterium]|nr:MAG: hypothetical protein DMG02_26830 [Acidobacteriota bacterium]
MKKRRPIERLSGLSASSKRLFRTLCAEYGIVDTGGCETLRSGLRSLEQAEAAEAIVRKDGRMLRDRFGQRRAHPMLVVARDFRSQWLTALRQLNLAIGEPPKVGRPEGA